MRFRASIHNITLLTKVTGAMAVTGKTGWLQIDNEHLQIYVQPEGNQSQVWSHVSVDAVFNEYKISSAADNIINLEIPLDTLHRSFKSCSLGAASASIRLTKKDGIPMLSLTITTESAASMNPTIITQDIPVRVLAPQTVSHIHRPVVPKPETAVMLPMLSQLRGITDRYVRMVGPNGRIVLEGNMNGVLKMKADSDAVKVESEWRALTNPVVSEDGDMDWDEQEDEEDELGTQERMNFSRVMIDSKEWAKVVKVCALGKRAIAWLCNNHALVVYVFMNEEGDNKATINYYVTSFST